MRLGKICFMALFLYYLSYAGIVSAQKNQLDLEQLMELALKKNADVQVQRGEERIAGFHWWQSFAAMLPQLDAEAGYWETSGENGVPDFIAANGMQEKMAWLSVQQTIFDARKLLAVSESRIMQQQSGIRFLQIRQDILLAVIQAYFEALKARDEIRVFRENLESFKLIYQQSEILYKNGVVPELDVKKSRVEYLLQQNDLAQAAKDYKIALNRIKELIGKVISDSLSITDFSSRKTYLDTMPKYIKIARENRPELRILKLEENQFLMEKRAAILGRLPLANAGAYYGWDTGGLIQDTNIGWQVYISLNMPLFHWGKLHLDRQIATIRFNQVEIRQQQLIKQIEQEVINAYTDAQIQLQQMQAMQESKKEAQEAVQMSKIGYQEGTVTNLDVINSQKLLTETNVNYSKAVYDFFLAKARLYRNMGKLREDYSWLN